jgi:hypothetical protein
MQASLRQPTGTTPQNRWLRSGRIRPIILLWALGVPIPIILLVLLIRGCVV